MKKLKYAGFVACILLCISIFIGCGKTPDKFNSLHEKNSFENLLKSKDSVEISMEYTNPGGEKNNRSFYMEKTKNSYNIYEELSSTEKVYFFNGNVYYGKYMVCYSDTSYKDIISQYFTTKQGFDGFNRGTYLYENVNPFYEEIWYFAESFGGNDNLEEVDGIKTYKITIENNEQLINVLSREGFKDVRDVYVSFSVDKDGFLTGSSLQYENSKDEVKDIFTKKYSYNTDNECFEYWEVVSKDTNVHQFTIYEGYQTKDESSRKYQIPEDVNVMLVSKNGNKSFYYDSFCSMPVNYGAVLSLKGDSFVFSESGKTEVKGGVFGIVQNKSGIFGNVYPGINEKLSYIQSYLDTYFYKDYDKTKIENAIYNAIFNNLDDKYAKYYTPDEYKKMLENDAGSYVGVGMVVTKENDEFIITTVYKNSPCEKAGIKLQDKIIAIDGKELAGLSLSETVALIRGEEGTTVEMTILRGEEKLTIPVLRETIESDTVYYEIKENGIGYIQISAFEKVTEEQFKKALLFMKDNNAKGIIFDLRNNPGGLMTVVGNMLDMIVSEGELYSSQTKLVGDLNKKATAEATIISCPFVCLVNKDSASGSELFAGCLQANNLATIVGETTYGKGIIQNTFGLPDGSGIKFTVGEYYLPGGKSIHEVGVTPDIAVSLPNGVGKINRTDGNDTQYKKAVEVLGNRIEGN